MYIENKGWERVESEQKRADAIIKEMADVIYFSDPENYSGAVKS
jgi:hypothetical protein